MQSLKLDSQIKTTTNERNYMTLGLAFWILMLLWLVFGFMPQPPPGQPVPPYLKWGGTLLLFILLFLLGWSEFGFALHK